MNQFESWNSIYLKLSEEGLKKLDSKIENSPYTKNNLARKLGINAKGRGSQLRSILRGRVRPRADFYITLCDIVGINGYDFYLKNVLSSEDLRKRKIPDNKLKEELRRRYDH